jgi:hypothetical protein
MKKSDSNPDHAWFTERIGVFVAGQLEADEFKRFSDHKVGCEDCAQKLENLLEADGAMMEALKESQPAADLDERIIQALRRDTTPRSRYSPFLMRAAGACAATVLLGVVGYMIDDLQRGKNRSDDAVVMVTELARAPKAPNTEPASTKAGYVFPLTDEKANSTLTPDEMARRQIDQIKQNQDLRMKFNSDREGKEEAFKKRAGAEHEKDALPANKDSSDITIPPDILAKAELGDHFETLDPDKPNAQSASMSLGYAANAKPSSEDQKGRDQFVLKNNGTIFQSSSSSGSGGSSSGGGGDASDASGGGVALEDVIGAADAAKTGNGGGWGGGSATGTGANSFGNRNGGGRKLMVKRQGGEEAKDNFYSYQNNTEEKKRATPNYFSPAELDSKKQTALADPRPAQEAQAKDVKRIQQAPTTPRVDTKADGDKPEPPPAPAEKVTPRYVIRNGEMEFEVDSFDHSYEQISKIATEENGYIASNDSEKLANGKVRGRIVLRVPPDRLDLLVLKLRALGELKSQRITSEDVSKKYNDTESELRAGRAMEGRLIEIIKTGKGDVSDLLKAEKELAVWREKIEKLEGEIRYYNNLISLSTLSLTLSERDIKTPTYASEQETVNTGIEAEDVEKAYSDTLKAIADVKGRVTASDLKQYEAGQFGASITCEVAPDSADKLRDRLKQLGRTARLTIEHKQSTQGGTGAPSGVRMDRKETQFIISLYNLANVAPRVTNHLNLAAVDTEAAYHVILARIEKAEGRVLTSTLNREKPEQTSATINFEVKSDDADAVLNDVRATGEVVLFNATENPDTSNVTRAKKGFVVQVFALSQVPPRESAQLEIATTQVADSYNKLADAVRAAKGRVLISQLDEKDRQNVTGRLEFEIMRTDLPALEKVLGGLGDVYSSNISRSSDTASTIDSKKRFDIGLFNSERLAPRETTTIGIELNDVDKASAEIAALAQKAGGRTVESHVSKDRSGRIVGKIVVDVPLSNGLETVAQIRNLGTVRMIESSRNSQVPDGALSRTRIDITIANADVLVPDDKGLSSTVRGSFSTSITGLLWSLQLIIVGLCFVGPWALILWLVIRWYRRKPAQS